MGAERAYGSYEEMLADPQVDIVYVATPHNYHKQASLLCLNAGKAVLCEKPAETDLARTAAMIDLAAEKKLFWMEAMWTRFLPVMVQVQQWLAEGKIGDLKVLTSTFGFKAPWNPKGRLLNPDLAGGATLDVGVYVVAMATMALGREIELMRAVGQIGKTGVDEQMAAQLCFVGGGVAQIACSVQTPTAHDTVIYGAEGRITIPDFWHATQATLKVYGQEPVKAEGEASYHYEAEEAMRCLRQGKLESAVMPWAESLAIAQILQDIRQQIGVVYPWEA